MKLETIDIFRIAVLKILEQKPLFTQAALARKINERPSCLNDFLHGRRNYPDYKRERIAKALGYNYIELLRYGQTLSENTEHIYLLKKQRHIKNNDKQINTLLTKVRFILSQEGPEKKFLVELVDVCYKSLISSKKNINI